MFIFLTVSVRMGNVDAVRVDRPAYEGAIPFQDGRRGVVMTDRDGVLAGEV